MFKLNAVSRTDFAKVYDQLHCIAAKYLHGERANHTLSPTALVNEAYLRMHNGGQLEHLGGNSQSRFFFTAAQAMRRILVESARRKRALKRGSGKQPVTFEDQQSFGSSNIELVIHIDEALDKMRIQWPELVRLVEMRFFAGLSMPEVASSLELSLRTAERNWQFAKAWLRDELEK